MKEGVWAACVDLVEVFKTRSVVRHHDSPCIVKTAGDSILLLLKGLCERHNVASLADLKRGAVHRGKHRTYHVK